MTPTDRVRVRAIGDTIEIVAELEPRRAEALALEVKSLAKHYGLEVQLERMTSARPDSAR